MIRRVDAVDRRREKQQHTFCNTYCGTSLLGDPAQLNGTAQAGLGDLRIFEQFWDISDSVPRLGKGLGGKRQWTSWPQW